MKKVKKFKTVRAGEWVQPVHRGYLMACCDCGLVHSMDFRVRNGKAQMRAFRNPELTEALRIEIPETNAPRN